MSKLKVTIEWKGKTYIREDNIISEESEMNPGDKELPLMGEAVERFMIEILKEITES